MNSVVATLARVLSVTVTDDTLSVDLEDGRSVSIPIGWYPRLSYGTPAERANFQISSAGYGIHWPELDEDIGVDGLLLGKHSSESAASFERWLQQRRERRMSNKNNQIAIGMSCANCGKNVDTVKLYQFISERAQGTEAYIHRPGFGLSAAALDFYLLLGAAGSVASLASILWMAYDKFISPQKAVGDEAGIYIAVRRPDGTVMELCLGRDVLTRDDFFRRFEALVDDARSPQVRTEHERTIEEIKTSNSWVRADMLGNEKN